MITAVENITLDGVMQAPATVDEDPRGGFVHGGWAVPFMDEVAMRVAANGMSGAGAMLLGRRTFEGLRRGWSGREENPFSAHLEAARKYVVSTTLGDEPGWGPTTRLDGPDAVRALDEPALTIIGSGVLVRGLLAAGLIDVLQLSIHPIVLGSGTRLFGDEGELARFVLAESVATTTGVLIATYRRATG